MSRVSAARIELELPRGAPLTGHSTQGRRATGTAEPLHATALALEGDRGRRAVLVFADLHTGTRFLWRHVSRHLEDQGLLGREALILAGSHTHSGPGRFYGSALYDAFAGPVPFLAARRARALAAQLARVVQTALEELRPGGLALVRPKVWGVGSNRSLPAFQRNPEAETWERPGSPGHGAPEGLPDADRMIDPRASALVAGDEQIRAVLATYGVHGTSLGSGVNHYSPDWAGYAARELAQGLSEGAVVGWAGGCSGDVSPVPMLPGSTRPNRPSTPSPALAAAVGEPLGRAVAAAASSAVVGEFDLAVAHTHWDTGADPLLAPACFGRATLGGAAGAPTPLFERLGQGTPGDHFPPSHLQHPKLPIPATGALTGQLAPARLPLHVLRVGSVLVATVPGEPTVTAGHRIERALGELPGIEAVVVLGYSGTYAGYFTTPEEYEAQRNEGASTLFGRRSLEALIGQLVALGRGLSSR